VRAAATHEPHLHARTHARVLVAASALHSLVSLTGHRRALHASCLHTNMNRWYIKGKGEGTLSWTPGPNTFPDGLADFHARTGWNITAHVCGYLLSVIVSHIITSHTFEHINVFCHPRLPLLTHRTTPRPPPPHSPYVCCFEEPHVGFEQRVRVAERRQVCDVC
jgi:hypothetical protein